MDLKRHLIAAGIALLAFLVLSLLSGPLGMPVLYAMAAIALASTAAYFHYRRRARREALTPTTPGRDDRVIPRDVRTRVIARDDGKCQLKIPGICLTDSQIDIDHKVPHTWGGSSKDEDNLWCACHPCNVHKGNRWADTPMGRLTREQFMRMSGRKTIRALV